MSSIFVKLSSSFRWILVLVIIGVSTLPAQGLSDTSYCEKKLSDTLDLICNYGIGAKLKRSVEPVDNYVDSENQMSSSFEDYPMISQFQQNSLAKTRRKRYGPEVASFGERIASVCCRKPCTMGELLMFCNQY
ncbi:uncharacterized protein LOC129951004 [Eupeodes corollae]|uniref:uncharacterized protein LOC129951004 n=1 Tax=Eupeodes corollae TaxID=290404 RepID=UPI00248F4836|nr:uncharacterized protein LOC129951004 [Eupeodes corollae]